MLTTDQLDKIEVRIKPHLDKPVTAAEQDMARLAKQLLDEIRLNPAPSPKVNRRLRDTLLKDSRHILPVGYDVDGGLNEETLPIYDAALDRMLINPGWEDKGRIHNWRNYVDGDMKELWDSLSEETRLLILVQAEHQASREEWD